MAVSPVVVAVPQAVRWRAQGRAYEVVGMVDAVNSLGSGLARLGRGAVRTMSVVVNSE